MTPCVQSRCSKPTELIPLVRGALQHRVMSCHIRYASQRPGRRSGTPTSFVWRPLFLFQSIQGILSPDVTPGSWTSLHSRPPYSLRHCAARGSRKEVFQPHLPVRLPCYDLAPVTGIALGRPSRSRTSGTPGSHGLTGGVYKARERIHRAMADARLLANPASWSRVADSNPNWDGVYGSATARTAASLCAPPL